MLSSIFDISDSKSWIALIELRVRFGHYNLMFGKARPLGRKLQSYVGNSQVRRLPDGNHVEKTPLL
jgi:hypothetical protein